MDGLFSLIRSTMSADKRRFVDGVFDLDLCYVTERIIAMSFPADGVESTYRNHIDEVAAMLHKYHEDHFLIFNLTERDYDTYKLHHRARIDSRYGLSKHLSNRVVNTGWWDHHAPPLALILHLCIDIHEHLLAHPKNVVVLHCLAGKGRTGLIASVYFMYCGLIMDANRALSFFAHRRSENNWGVSQPGQRRYARYCQEIFNGTIVPHSKAILIKCIVMHTIPGFDSDRTGCAPFIEIFNVSDRLSKKQLHATPYPSIDYASMSDNPEVKREFVVDCLVHGDIQIVLKHNSVLGSSVMGRLQFHTGMLSHPTMALFPKVELDDACKDSRFARGFAIHIQYEQLEIEPLIAALEATRGLLPSSEDSLTDALDQTNEQLDDATMNLAADMKHLLQFQLNDYFDEALHTDWTHKPLSRDGTSCFFGDVNSKISRAREFDTPVSSIFTERGGWLTKQGVGGLRAWKRRWVVLKSNTLMYYRAPTSSQPQGSIEISEVLNVCPNKENGPAAFDVITNGRFFSFMAEDEREMEEWMEAIDVARNRCESAWELSNGTRDELLDKLCVIVCGLRRPLARYSFVAHLAEVHDQPDDVGFDYLCVLKLENQIANAERGKPVVFTLPHIFLSLIVTVMATNSGMIFGRVVIDIAKLVLEQQIDSKRWCKVVCPDSNAVVAELLLHVKLSNERMLEDDTSASKQDLLMAFSSDEQDISYDSSGSSSCNTPTRPDRMPVQPLQFVQLQLLPQPSPCGSPAGDE